MEEEIIIKQIIESANEEAKQIVNETIAQAKKIEEKNYNYEAEKAKEEYEIQKNRVMKQVSSEIEKAEFEARSSELIERKKYIEIIKEKVKQKILDLDSEEYIKIITEIIEKYKKEKNVEILLPNKCYEKIKEIAVNNGIKVLESTDEFYSGVIIKCGDLEYNYNFEENMEYLNETIEKNIDSILFN